MDKAKKLTNVVRRAVNAEFIYIDKYLVTHRVKKLGKCYCSDCRITRVKVVET